MNCKLADALPVVEGSKDHVVLHRLHAPSRYNENPQNELKIGIVLDTETTGLDTQNDSIIELGFIVFEYNPATGLIYRILHSYTGFEDPGSPLSDDVKQITGITDEMLAGKKFNDEIITDWLQKAQLIIAHNAAFDRQLCERRFPICKKLYWACSINDIDWKQEGITSAKLDYIAFKMGFFFDGHRAVNDALATLHMLSMNLPSTRGNAMLSLLNSARQKTRRFFALAAPFDKKDELKARGYRWHPDFVYESLHGQERKGVWGRAVPYSDLEDEQSWLSLNVYASSRLSFVFKDVTAQDRYSIKEMENPANES